MTRTLLVALALAGPAHADPRIAVTMPALDGESDITLSTTNALLLGSTLLAMRTDLRIRYSLRDRFELFANLPAFLNDAKVADSGLGNPQLGGRVYTRRSGVMFAASFAGWIPVHDNADVSGGYEREKVLGLRDYHAAAPFASFGLFGDIRIENERTFFQSELGAMFVADTSLAETHLELENLLLDLGVGAYLSSCLAWAIEGRVARVPVRPAARFDVALAAALAYETRHWQLRGRLHPTVGADYLAVGVGVDIARRF